MNDREEFQKGCFGMTLDKVEDFLEEAVDWSGTVDKAAASLCSDVQEMIELGQKENARKTLNMVKHLLFEAEKFRQYEN